MKFIVDAQLPWRLKLWLAEKGLDVIHTEDLPERNKTHDIEIANLANTGNRILISKDGDFLKLKILQNKPRRLLLITTGNISNNDLLDLFARNFEIIAKLFDSFEIVELNNSFVLGRNLD